MPTRGRLLLVLTHVYPQHAVPTIKGPFPPISGAAPPISGAVPPPFSNMNSIWSRSLTICDDTDIEPLQYETAGDDISAHKPVVRYHKPVVRVVGRQEDVRGPTNQSGGLILTLSYRKISVHIVKYCTFLLPSHIEGAQYRYRIQSEEGITYR